jgi:hypothetical protein
MGVLRPSVFALFVLVMVLLFGSLFMAAEKKAKDDHAGKVPSASGRRT